MRGGSSLSFRLPKDFGHLHWGLSGQARRTLSSLDPGQYRPGFTCRLIGGGFLDERQSLTVDLELSRLRSPPITEGIFATIGRVVRVFPLTSYVPAFAVNGSHAS